MVQRGRRKDRRTPRKDRRTPRKDRRTPRKERRMLRKQRGGAKISILSENRSLDMINTALR